MTSDVPAAAGRLFLAAGLLAMVAVGAALGMAGDGPAREIGPPAEVLAGESIRVQPASALAGLTAPRLRLEALVVRLEQIVPALRLTEPRQRYGTAQARGYLLSAPDH
jgi:hypothetical protein